MERLMKILRKSHRSKAGFTLIELMIVVIIVGILAAAAVPIYTSYVERAYRTEAEASLGAIRTAQIAYKAEHGDFADNLGTTGDPDVDGETSLGMVYEDFENNRYFSEICFSTDGTSAICVGTSTTTPNPPSAVTDTSIQMNLTTGEVSDYTPP